MALKVIELDIDYQISGDTGIEEIALVLQPAIETNFLYFKNQDFVEEECECEGDTCELNDDIETDFVGDKGIELEELLKQGYEIIDMVESDASKINKELSQQFNKMNPEEFYQIITKPGENSIYDFAGSKRRFIYTVGFGAKLIPTSRNFCKRMLGGRQFVFRYEDIQALSAQIEAEPDNQKIIPRPKGTPVDIFTYKSGSNCRHKWTMLILKDPIVPNNNTRRMEEEAQLQMPSWGQSGQVNPPVQYASRRGEMSKDKVIPSGFIQGLPVFNNVNDATEYSINNGCEGIVEEVEYLGKKMFQACSYNKKQNMSVQFSVDKEKRMIYSPAMKPNILIPRIDEDTKEKYFVTFKPETIERMAQRFLMEKKTDKMNYEHSDIKFNKVYVVESWIVSGDSDKAYQLGYDKLDVPRGTWMVGLKVEDDEVWEMVKSGQVRGLSVEGNFNYKFNKSPENKNDEYLLNEIINIIKTTIK